MNNSFLKSSCDKNGVKNLPIIKMAVLVQSPILQGMQQSGLSIVPAGPTLLSAAGTRGSVLSAVGDVKDVNRALTSGQVGLASAVVSPRQMSVVVPVGTTPLAPAVATGLIKPNEPVAVTSIPENTGIVVTALTPSPRTLARRRLPQSAPVLEPVPILASLPPLQGSSPVLTPRSRSMRRRQLSAPQEVKLQEDSAEELRKFGYTPISSIAVRDPDGTMGARYIKAHNPMGQIVYISLDGGGYTVVQPNDLTHIDERVAQVVPLSVKSEAMSTAGNGVNGVAFECNEGVCTIVRNRTMEPVETSFVYVEKRSDRAATLGSDLFGYPIIRLSDIKANPREVLRQTMAATSNMRNSVYTSCMQTLRAEEAKLKALNEAFHNFSKARDQAAHDLKHSMAKLVSYREQYLQNPAAYTSEVEVAKHRAVYEELQRRNNLFTLLPSACRQAAKISDHLSAATNTLNSLTALVQQHFAHINK